MAGLRASTPIGDCRYTATGGRRLRALNLESFAMNSPNSGYKLHLKAWPESTTQKVIDP